MIRTTATVLAAAILATAGCGADDATKKDANEKPTGAVDVVSGNPLSQYEGRPSYDWRARLGDTHKQAGNALAAVAPFLSEDDLDQIIATCDAIDRGIGGQQLVAETATRFSGGPGEQVNASQAKALIAVSKKWACPA